ncbi:MAG TPA: asparagine synthase (glutamine-hydrolyzing) [Chitinispirillaceae bacterium]|nr:asparagine synthase (glutamine-hydrolyzing) [Chitinispirillaceae bacterium]
MCGIAGFWNLDNAPVNIKMLDLFTDSLAHRGPDGRGVFIDDTVALGLGHRRLSIIDTTTIAHQPMEYSDGRYQITFNGEIYNFIELKKELIVAGYSFSTESDTEIILAAYDKWGEECQLKFNGMWAFALWDKKVKKLFLSRDRFGVKPLYYCFDGIHFAFASEMKAFLALKWFDPSFDEVVVASVINGATLDGTDICLLKNLKRLPGGFSISLQENTGPVLKRWWNTLDHLVEIPKTYEEQVARYRELFLEACLLRMRSDVPIGTSLSGGLDSSSSICGMKRVRDTWKNSERGASDWQKAFVALYPGTLQDEEKYAEIVIKYTRVHPVYCEITPKTLLDHYKEIIFQFESISEIPIGPWILYNAQRENGVVVSVDGHGGDEALGGYHHYPEALMRQEMALGFFHLFKFYQYRSLLQRLFVNPKMCNAPDLTEFLFRNLVGFMTSMMNILKSALLSTPNATD